MSKVLGNISDISIDMRKLITWVKTCREYIVVFRSIPTKLTVLNVAILQKFEWSFKYYPERKWATNETAQVNKIEQIIPLGLLTYGIKKWVEIKRNIRL